jgi:hypothetical protein
MATMGLVVAGTIGAHVATRSLRFVRVHPYDPLPRARGLTPRKPAISALGLALTFVAGLVILTAIGYTIWTGEPPASAVLPWVSILALTMGAVVVTNVWTERFRKESRRSWLPLLIAGVGLVVVGFSAPFYFVGVGFLVGVAAGAIMTLGGLAWVIRDRARTAAVDQPS